MISTPRALALYAVTFAAYCVTTGLLIEAWCEWKTEQLVGMGRH